MSPLGLLWWLFVVIYCGESIFKYEYLCEDEAKIENIYTLVCGPKDVSLGLKISKNRVRWTVPLKIFWLCSACKRLAPPKCIICSRWQTLCYLAIFLFRYPAWSLPSTLSESVPGKNQKYICWKYLNLKEPWLKGNYFVIQFSFWITEVH